MVVIGYSAAQANHFTCVESSQASVQPFSSPSTARPALSQREPVSLSMNVWPLPSRFKVNVTRRVGAGGVLSGGDTPSLLGCGPENFRGGEASGRYAEAVRVEPSHSTTRDLPSICSAI